MKPKLGGLVNLDGSRKVGLMGWPVAHSLSPAMHNAAFRALGLDWQYVLLPVQPEELATGLAGLIAEGYDGANVTVPHKRAVMAHLDEIDGTAQAIGAVNTIAVRGQRLLGYNTDAPGFLRALREAGLEPSRQHALVLGAGGAARAVAFALAKDGCAVTIHNRTVPRGAVLARHLQSLDLAGPVVWVQEEPGLRELDLDRFDLLVNATTVGMWPHCDDSPLPEDLSLPSHWNVVDLVYNPLETRLLREARRAGARAIDGLGMLVWQGALAFELWTGQEPPVGMMRTAALEALAITQGP